MTAPSTGECVQEKLRGGGQMKVRRPKLGGMCEMGWRWNQLCRVFFRLMLLAVSCALQHLQHLCWQEAVPCTAFYSCSLSFCFQLCGLWGEQLMLECFQYLLHEQRPCSFLNLSNVSGAGGGARSLVVLRVGRTLLSSALGWPSCPQVLPRCMTNWLPVCSFTQCCQNSSSWQHHPLLSLL